MYKRSNYTNGSRTAKQPNKVRPDETRPKAHAAESMQPRSEFPEEALVTTLTICVMYLWHFLSAATPQRRKRGSKEISVTASQAADMIICKPPGCLQRLTLSKSATEPLMSCQTLFRFVQSRSTSLSSNQRENTTHAGGRTCNGIGMTAGGGEECVFCDGLRDEAGKFLAFGKKSPLRDKALVEFPDNS